MSKEFLHYALSRLMLYITVYLFIFSFTIFMVVMYAPGDPIQVLAGKGASDEVINNLRHEYGLDKPILIQYGEYMVRFLRFDWGESLRFPGQDVKDLIWERFPFSALIGVTAFVLSATVGTAAGLIAAFKKGSWIEGPLLYGSFFFAVIPSLILVQILVFIFGLELRWLPVGWSGGWQKAFSLTAVIPIMTLFLVSVSGFAWFVRSITLNIVDQPYVLAAKAKGIPPWRILTHYVLRNAMLPFVTSMLPALFLSVEGSFFVERIYGIPGLAAFTLDSVFGRDYPVILALGILGSMFSILMILLVDLLYKFVDPRVNVSK